MNIGELVSTLLPVFFVLALGYFAGRRNAFDADQAAGLSKLALSFALPASLFVSMTDSPKRLLLQQGRLVLAITVPAMLWIGRRRRKEREAELLFPARSSEYGKQTRSINLRGGILCQET
jgi:hypothetical protein